LRESLCEILPQIDLLNAALMEQTGPRPSLRRARNLRRSSLHPPAPDLRNNHCSGGL